MNKTSILKVLLAITIMFGLVLMSTVVLADDTIDLTNTLQGGGVDLNSIDLNSIDLNSINTNGIDLNSIDTNNIDLNSIDTNNIDLNSINTNNIDLNSLNTNSANNTNTPTNENNATTNTNSNSSSYAESDIPHAGVETSVLAIAAFIVCAIIGLYTFMKLSDYSNI